MNSNKAQTPAQKAWPQRQFVDKLTQLTLPAIAVFVYSVAQLIHVGGEGTHYVFMLTGSIAAIIGAFVYVMASYTHGATGKRSLVGMFSAIAGFLPYLFGCYLVFYQGFWGFKELSSGFSLWLIIKAMVAVVLGFRIVNSMYQITEIDKSVKPGVSGLTAAERLDNTLAQRSGFDNAVKVYSLDESSSVINAIDPDQLLELVGNELMNFKGKRYEVLHFKNRETGQNRSLYFDITDLPADSH